MGLCACIVLTLEIPAGISENLDSTAVQGLNIVDDSGIVSIIGVGDVMLGSWIIPLIAEKGTDYPFRATDWYLESADITIANLEAPFTIAGEAFEKTYSFKIPPEYAAGIATSGIDVVTLANNHIMDFGVEGLISTITTLDSFGVFHCGAGKNINEANMPAIVVSNGKKVAFFGYSMTFPAEFYASETSAGTAYPEPELLKNTLTVWDKFTDFMIVSFHWSAEKRDFPKEYQIEFARLAIDHGADLVIGHHPHVLQGFELYKNRLIAYSLGNYVFGSYSKHARDSIILKVYLGDEGLVYAHCIPINVDNQIVEFQPQVLAGDGRAAVMARLQKLSSDLNDHISIIDDNGIILGDWDSFYEHWLQESVLGSYWNTPFAEDIVNSHNVDSMLTNIKSPGEQGN
jgi:poly-gamma-glutamate synthesis protein (capsule biosynthesis protein)